LLKILQVVDICGVFLIVIGSVVRAVKSHSSGKKPNFDPKPQKSRNDSSYQFELLPKKLMKTAARVMGARWLMIHVTDEQVLDDVKRLIRIRYKRRGVK